MTTQKPVRILKVIPAMGVAQGEATIHCEGFEPGLPDRAKVMFGEVEAQIVSASEDRVVVLLPSRREAVGPSLWVNGTRSEVYPYSLAMHLASGLHPVSSPVVAPDGSLITTISGRRGEQVAQPLVRITRGGQTIPFACSIVNPTGLAFGPDRQLYISSRNDGTVFRYTDFESLDLVAENLGVACGIAFDSHGSMYVGDRSGTIHKVSTAGHSLAFASLEPSVSAYHLLMDPDDNLYVTAPTLSVHDPLIRVSTDGKVQSLVRGLGRPQGMALHRDGSILVAAAYKGKKGVFRYGQDGSFEQFVSSPTLVGLAVANEGIFLADSSSVYWLEETSSSRRVV